MMMLTDDNNVYLDKIFKVREKKVKSSRQPLEATSTPQTPNLPSIDTFKSPPLKTKKK